MLYWLQQLQMKRWEFHNSPPALPVTPAAGLSGNGPTLHLNLGTNGLASCHITQAFASQAFPLLLGAWEDPCLPRSGTRNGI